MAREVAEAMLPPWERHKRMSHPYGTLVLSPKQPPFPLPRRSLSTHPSSGDYVPPVSEKPGGPSAPGATVRESCGEGQGVPGRPSPISAGLVPKAAL